MADLVQEFGRLTAAGDLVIVWLDPTDGLWTLNHWSARLVARTTPEAYARLTLAGEDNRMRRAAVMIGVLMGAREEANREEQLWSPED